MTEAQPISNLSLHILFGISGGIAAYKTPEIVRLLIKEGHNVRCVLTKHATHFVTKTTLGTLSKNPPLEEQFVDPEKVQHLDLARSTDMLVIAPATANIIAKFANGIADDLLSTLFLAYKGPKLIVPAMHTEMFTNPITQANIQKLKDFGVHFLGPDTGELACGDQGVGRMVDPVLIVDKIRSLTYSSIPLSGKKILITAGGTRQAIDQMRFITNRSTGMLGYSLAATAAFWGADVTLVSTMPLAVNNPEIKHIISVDSAEEMQRVVQSQIVDYDYLFMAAAVSDFTCELSGEKIKRADRYQLNLIGTPDILKSIAHLKAEKIFVGFCLEDENLIEVAYQKLKEKKLDYIIANTSKTIGKSIRSVHLIRSDHVELLTNFSVWELANVLLSRVCLS